MKTHANVFEQVVSFDALHAGYLRARRGKRRSWSCRVFERDLEENLIQLQNELIWGEYKTGPYRSFEVTEPKRRTITALQHFRDRVLQQSLVSALEPLWERSFIGTSYACRPGRGAHAGASRAQLMMRQCLREHGALFALKADVRKYFASIDHGHLKRILRRKLSDTKVLALLDDIIDGYCEPGTPGKGIPIGNLVSQLLANVYMDQLDHYVKEGCRERRYIRYMDDFVVIHHNKQHLQALRFRLQRFLSDHLGLELNRKTAVFPVATKHGRGLDFLGYHLWPSKRRLRKASLRRLKRRIRSAARKFAAGQIDMADVKQQLHSMIRHAQHGEADQAIHKALAGTVFRRTHG